MRTWAVAIVVTMSLMGCDPDGGDNRFVGWRGAIVERGEHGAVLRLNGCDRQERVTGVLVREGPPGDDGYDDSDTLARVEFEPDRPGVGFSYGLDATGAGFELVDPARLNDVLAPSSNELVDVLISIDSDGVPSSEEVTTTGAQLATLTARDVVRGDRVVVARSDMCSLAVPGQR